MTVTKEQIRKLCYQDKIYFGKTLMNRDEDRLSCSHTNVIELYSKIKQYGRENGLFLNNNPYDTFSYADELTKRAKEFWPNLTDYDPASDNQHSLGFIFNIKFYIPFEKLDDFCEIIANAINNA